MQIPTSAKRVISFLICLNIVTILTSIIIIHSETFIANAATPPCSPIGLVNSSNITFNNTKYSGQLLNSAPQAKLLASITLTFTTDSQHNLTQADFTDKPVPKSKVPKNGGVPISLANGALDRTTSQQTLSSFVIDTKERDNNVTIDFIGGNVVGKKIGGVWEIHDPNGQYNGFFGRWLVTAT